MTARMLDDEMENSQIFLKLTEHARRHRLLRIDLGEEKAELKINTGGGGDWKWQQRGQQNWGKQGGGGGGGYGNQGQQGWGAKGAGFQTPGKQGGGYQPYGKGAGQIEGGGWQQSKGGYGKWGKGGKGGKY